MGLEESSVKAQLSDFHILTLLHPSRPPLASRFCVGWTAVHSTTSSWPSRVCTTSFVCRFHRYTFFGRSRESVKILSVLIWASKFSRGGGREIKWKRGWTLNIVCPEAPRVLTRQIHRIRDGNSKWLNNNLILVSLMSREMDRISKFSIFFKNRHLTGKMEKSWPRWCLVILRARNDPLATGHAEVGKDTVLGVRVARIRFQAFALAIEVKGYVRPFCEPCRTYSPTASAYCPMSPPKCTCRLARIWRSCWLCSELSSLSLNSTWLADCTGHCQWAFSSIVLLKCPRCGIARRNLKIST